MGKAVAVKLSSIDSPIKDWFELERVFRQRIHPVLQSDSEIAADRWHNDFATNPLSALGLALTYAAMEAAGVWNTVGRLINAWAVGMFFIPSIDVKRLMDRNRNFTPLDTNGFRHRLARHSYWERSWIQTNVRQAAIHIGIHRELENGEPKAEVHLDVFNGFHNGFDAALSVKHVFSEVLLKRQYPIDEFQAMLHKENIAIPSVIRGPS